MTIEYREDEHGDITPVMVECALCGMNLPDGVSFGMHYQAGDCSGETVLPDIATDTRKPDRNVHIGHVWTAEGFTKV